MRSLVLRPGREGPVHAGHPWIFSGAVASGLDGAEPGEPVRVVSSGGSFVAVGYANPRTSIAVRVCALDDVAVDARLVARRVDEALGLRRAMLASDAHAYRVLNGEGDRLPGVVVDRYADVLVCQFLTAGAARLGPAVIDALVARLAPRTVYERSEGGVRAEEGIAGARGLVFGEEPPPRVAIVEDGCTFLVDVVGGQKTGFFLDQRDTRKTVRNLAAGKRVLNAFGYTGSISIAAAMGDAQHVVTVDASRPALEIAEAAWTANGLDDARATFIEGDLFDWLREPHEPFDLIVLDPPPFVRRRRDLEAGYRGYRDVNLQALRRLAPGGWLVTCSCSQHVGRQEFRRVVADAANDAGRALQVVAELGHPADHPVALAHTEGDYLKVLVART